MVTNKSQKIRKAANETRIADFWYTIAYRTLELHRYAMKHWKQHVETRDEELSGIQTMYEPAPDSEICTEHE